ncbi:hypothetical protein DH2020_010716 [Rehmannia glutinosa]|uniref:Peroxidase n=1 Tax=Rehmannia glutinosa TaxID=99300 RepID=A0ABR0XBC0_REHGL
MADSKISKFVAFMVVFSLMICSTTMAKSKSSGSKLRVGYYYKTCPQAEMIVRKAVNKAVSKNPGIAAGLIRMHFHDCFVRGCDGSVLLDTVPGKPAAEKDNIANFPSLQGLNSLKVGWIGYDVPSGRRDGRVSLSSEVLQNLPPPFFSAPQLRDNFRTKGLSLDDMVTLSGSHSIGVSHCSSFSSRLSGFNATFDQDPSLNPGFASFLKTRCPAGNSDPVVSNDFQTPNRLDNKYYANLKVQKGLLTSDQTLFDSPLTRKLVVENAKYGFDDSRAEVLSPQTNDQVITSDDE